MPITGSSPNQLYTRSDGVRTGTAVNQTAETNGVNNTSALSGFRENDIATALSTCLLKTGGNQPSANLPMNTYKHTGVGLGTTRSDYARLDQAQDGNLIWGGVAGGTANAITLDLSPNITVLEAGQTIVFLAAFDNTTAATANPDALGAIAIQVAGLALVGGEIQQNQIHRITSDGTQFQLENPVPLPLDADLAAIAALTTTSFGRSVLTVTDAPALATLTGVGTGNSPQLTAIELGHATDTTLARSGAGEITVEGNRIFRVGGADVPIADGGTAARAMRESW